MLGLLLRMADLRTLGQRGMNARKKGKVRKCEGRPVGISVEDRM